MLEAPNAPPVLKVNGEEDAALLAPKGCPKPGETCGCPKMEPPAPNEELVEPNAGVLEPNRLGVDACPKTLPAEDCCPKPAPNAVLPNGAAPVCMPRHQSEANMIA